MCRHNIYANVHTFVMVTGLSTCCHHSFILLLQTRRRQNLETSRQESHTRCRPRLPCISCRTYIMWSTRQVEPTHCQYLILLCETLGNAKHKGAQALVQWLKPRSLYITSLVKTTCLDNRRSRVRAPLWPSNFKGTKSFFPVHS